MLETIRTTDTENLLIAFDILLQQKVFLIGYHITIADLYLFARLYDQIVLFFFFLMH